jgi:hypothetical protein
MKEASSNDNISTWKISGDWFVFIVIGAVTGFILSKAVTPLLQKHSAQSAKRKQ